MESSYLVAAGAALLVFLGTFFGLSAVILQKWIFFPGLVPMLGMMGARIAFVVLEPKKHCPKCGKFMQKIGATPGTLIGYFRGFRSCSHCKTRFDRRGERALV
jgi:hypothetical protein